MPFHRRGSETTEATQRRCSALPLWSLSLCGEKAWLTMLKNLSKCKPGEVKMSFSIMITTKNRLQDLKRTCDIIKRLDPPPSEILITADGCTDKTVEFVKSEMPGAKLIVNDPGIGSVGSRDRMMREAQGEFIFSLDDDSYPEQLD